MRLAKLLTFISFYLLSASYGLSVNTPEDKAALTILNNNFDFRIIPGGPADAGADQDICDLQTTVLEGNDPAPGTGTWSVSSGPGNMIFDDPKQFDTQVLVDQYGSYTLTWTVDDGTVTSDNVIINFYEQPVADAGPDQTLRYTFETELNAQLAERESGRWELIRGAGTIDDTTAPATAITGLTIGENVLLWTVSNGVCPESSDYLRIYVNDLLIPSLITPNMDGRNDFFELKGIQNLGQTELVIFDRSGVKVYENTDYDNSWDGTDQKGNALPEDTYYYVIRSTKGVSQSGYIVIRR
ncbi:MAG: gliding motility-associated C-terminal domain-containing protein [Bacteroidales bacterium]